MTLAERFAHNRSLGPVQRAINTLYFYVLNDPTSRQLMLEIDIFIRGVLMEVGYLATAACVTRADDLWTRLDSWLSNEVYAAQWNAMWACISHFLGSNADADTNKPAPAPNAANWFADDPLTRELEVRWTALIDSLVIDNGRLAFKRAMWADLGRLCSSVVNWRGFITLPRVELMTPNVELILENVHLSLANLFPTVLDVQVHD